MLKQLIYDKLAVTVPLWLHIWYVFMIRSQTHNVQRLTFVGIWTLTLFLQLTPGRQYNLSVSLNEANPIQLDM